MVSESVLDNNLKEHLMARYHAYEIAEFLDIDIEDFLIRYEDELSEREEELAEYTGFARLPREEGPSE